MKLLWAEPAWEEYCLWQTEDKKTLKRINELIRDAQRTPFCGLGKPEPLKGALAGCWSRRIDEKNRLVYRVNGDAMEILECKGHYED